MPFCRRDEDRVGVRAGLVTFLGCGVITVFSSRMQIYDCLIRSR